MLTPKEILLLRNSFSIWGRQYESERYSFCRINLKSVCPCSFYFVCGEPYAAYWCSFAFFQRNAFFLLYLNITAIFNFWGCFPLFQHPVLKFMSVKWIKVKRNTSTSQILRSEGSVRVVVFVVWRATESLPFAASLLTFLPLSVTELTELPVIRISLLCSYLFSLSGFNFVL